MHLRERSDRRTVVWALILAPAACALQYVFPVFAGWMLPVSIYLAYCAGVIAHNHNHCPTFAGRRTNAIWSMWISFFYGYPTFAWIPTHNANHHKFVNRPGDATITSPPYRPDSPHSNRARRAVAYPFVSAAAQSPLILAFLRRAKASKSGAFGTYLAQYVVVLGGHAFACALAMRLHGRALGLYVYFSALGIPALGALWGILFTNYVQHVDCDPWSRWNHSRNFVSPWMNYLVFDNGFHTVHHHRPGLHWSHLRAEHAKVAHLIDPRLEERSIVAYCFKAYVRDRVSSVAGRALRSTKAHVSGHRPHGQACP